MKDYSKKLALLRLLSSDEFCSGEDIGAKLGISRAAVSKHIQFIQSLGVDIFGVQGKGYKLSKPLRLLDEAEIVSKLGSQVKVMPIINSTNQYLLERVDFLESGAACIAECQLQGRGRRGRHWVSPLGENIYASMYWRLDAGVGVMAGLSLAIGVSIVEAFESIDIKGVKLKWPNDLYYQNKKLAGILIEVSGQAGSSVDLIIGVGLNVEDLQSKHKIDQPCASLSDVIDTNAINRTELASLVVEALTRAMREYEIRGLTGLKLRWDRFDNYINKSVRLIMPSGEVYGISRGINEQGAIILENDNGYEHYMIGDISLRASM